MSNKLEALAERCEKATGPDRELDLAIFLTLWPESDLAHMTKYPRGLNHQEGYAWDIHRQSVVFEKWTADGRCPHNGGYPLPDFTSSMDAALTLKPDDHSWAGGDLDEENRVWCCVTSNVSGIDSTAMNAITVPLAICAASLRAQAADARGNETQESAR